MIIKPITLASAALTSLLLLSAAGAAFAAPAGELYPATEQYQAAPITPVKTRADVAAEIIQARATGQLVDGEAGYAIATQLANTTTQLAVAGKTRAEVINEFRQASSDGTLVKIGEIEQFPVAQLAGTPRSRADVRAEAIQSARSTTNLHSDIR